MSSDGDILVHPQIGHLIPKSLFSILDFCVEVNLLIIKNLKLIMYCNRIYSSLLAGKVPDCFGEVLDGSLL